MDKVIIAICVLIIIGSFYIVIHSVVRQLRGGKCPGCPACGCTGCGFGKKGNCRSCK